MYVDSYEEDLFGHNDTGCAIITYDNLKKRNLVKDINLNDVSCATEDTYVRVVKLEGRYGYAAQLGCGKKEDTVTQYRVAFFKNNLQNKKKCYTMKYNIEYVR